MAEHIADAHDDDDDDNDWDTVFVTIELGLC